MTKIAQTNEGAWLIPCPGCQHIIRSHPNIEYRDVNLNWTVTCPDCLRKLCLVCFPTGATHCTLPDCAAIKVARDTKPDVLHFTDAQRAG